MPIKTFRVGFDNSLGYIKDIRAEFGGPAGFQQDGRIKPVPISQYYRGGFYVPNRAENLSIPLAGVIKSSDFFGTTFGGLPPTLEFPNASFEQGLLGWTAILTALHLNGGSTILGYPTPTDPSPNPVSAPDSLTFTGDHVSPGDVGYSADYGGRTVVTVTADVAPGGGSSSLALNTGTHIVPPGGMIYGPGFYSNQPVYVEKGTKLSFYWRAVSDADMTVGDGYNVFAYMLNPINGKTIVILDTNADRLGYVTAWQKQEITFTAEQRGIYHFIFISGSWDTTFGTVVGSYFYIDSVILDNRVLYE